MLYTVGMILCYFVPSIVIIIFKFTRKLLFRRVAVLVSLENKFTENIGRIEVLSTICSPSVQLMF